MINGIRFIIGSGCNFNCFYCHHEGVTKDKITTDYNKKIEMIRQFCDKNNVTKLSITGGEPMIYLDKVKLILNKFNDHKFTFSINTNGSLLNQEVINYLSSLDSDIELHINVSSLNNKTHKLITKTIYHSQLMNNLELLSNNKNIKVCLNTILLEGINDGEILSLLKYCDDRKFLLRLLQYLPSSEKDVNLVIDEKILKSKLNGVQVSQMTSYGIFNCELEKMKFQFVKNLCCEKLCDICKNNTYIHFTPDLNVKMCMQKEDINIINYSSIETVNTDLNLL